ncbi:Ceramidase [Salinihabitans flavidus]|uniref:Ceramidase n=1 Tax=Salinihabitans flavidus TaxID=569882 RepID=A0A1H8QHZ0_9RHOB|nr:ceramidase domain-containing protein [Salinihabitans flavidus]SEO53840.1 Ceramidase [Salinihabitans flavidus]
MDWMQAVDSYCERGGPAFWAEPVNALTNIAFLIAAAVMWPRVRQVPLGPALAVVLALIGVGSFLFHSVAQVWAGLADVVPIVVFILIYLWAVHRHVWNWPVRGAWAAVALFFPYAALMVPVFGAIPGMQTAAGYAPVPLLIVVEAWLLRQRAPGLARGMAVGAGLLSLSLLFRSLDTPLCGIWPVGTHFLWHCLNAVMLGWMIEVYRRHMLAPAPSRR